MLAWQQGWTCASRPALIIQDVWHVIIRSNADADMKFDSMYALYHASAQLLPLEFSTLSHQPNLLLMLTIDDI